MWKGKCIGMNQQRKTNSHVLQLGETIPLQMLHFMCISYFYFFLEAENVHSNMKDFMEKGLLCSSTHLQKTVFITCVYTKGYQFNMNKSRIKQI